MTIDSETQCGTAGSRFLDPDGTFPNHSPNPENKEAMKAGSEAVKQSGSDLGIVVDTVGPSPQKSRSSNQHDSAFHKHLKHVWIEIQS